MDVKCICPFDGRINWRCMRRRGQENSVGKEAGGSSVQVNVHKNVLPEQGCGDHAYDEEIAQDHDECAFDRVQKGERIHKGPPHGCGCNGWLRDSQRGGRVSPDGLVPRCSLSLQTHWQSYLGQATHITLTFVVVYIANLGWLGRGPCCSAGYSQSFWGEAQIRQRPQGKLKDLRDERGPPPGRCDGGWSSLQERRTGQRHAVGARTT